MESQPRDGSYSDVQDDQRFNYMHHINEKFKKTRWKNPWTHKEFKKNASNSAKFLVTYEVDTRLRKIGRDKELQKARRSGVCIDDDQDDDSDSR